MLMAELQPVCVSVTALGVVVTIVTVVVAEVAVYGLSPHATATKWSCIITVSQVALAQHNTEALERGRLTRQTNVLVTVSGTTRHVNVIVDTLETTVSIRVMLT